MLLKKKSDLSLAELFPEGDQSAPQTGNQQVPVGQGGVADTLVNAVQKNIPPPIDARVAPSVQPEAPPETVAQIAPEAPQELTHAQTRQYEKQGVRATVAEQGAEGDLTPSTWLNAVFQEAVRLDASDVHIVPEKEHISVRFRINGMIHEVAKWDIDYHEMVMSRIKIIAGMQVVEKNVPQDGHLEIFFEMDAPGAGGGESGEKNSVVKEFNFRVSTMPSINGETAVLRALSKEGTLLSIDQVGFSPSALPVAKKILERGHGIFLMTGHNGSGKTTTLYAILDYLNVREKAILTLEDPVEYRLQNVRQSQVNAPLGFTFELGLRALLRQDPDIIMIGEIRDEETAGAAMRLALVGRLVLATLHTSDIAGAVVRMIDMDIGKSIIASAFTGIANQRLVKKICSDCKVETQPPYQLMEMFNIEWTGEPVYMGRGCESCHHTGYDGRVAIFEVLEVDDEFRSLIMRHASFQEVGDYIKTAVKESLRNDGFNKVRQGITTLEEVIQATI